MEGNMKLSDRSVYYASGTTLAMFPTNGSFMYSADLKDQSEYIVRVVAYSLPIVWTIAVIQ